MRQERWTYGEAGQGFTGRGAIMTNDNNSLCSKLQDLSPPYLVHSFFPLSTSPLYDTKYVLHGVACETRKI